MKSNKFDKVRPSSTDTLISIVITHHDYSRFIRGALLSIVDQTHEKFECIVVDDGSNAGEVRELKSIIGSISDKRISAVFLADNMGQIPAFYHGLDLCSGDFICLLDPDDRYENTFLESSLEAHLNRNVICPISSTDQFLVRGNSVIASNICGHRKLGRNEVQSISGSSCEPQVLFIPSIKGGWHWSSTSSLMIRRAAADLMRPHKKLLYNNCADGYLAQGAHALGGTLFIEDSLVYRYLHEDNAWISSEIYSSFQNTQRAEAVRWASVAKIDALEAIRANGGPNLQVNANMDRVVQTAALPAEEGDIFKRFLRSFNKHIFS